MAVRAAAKAPREFDDMFAVYVVTPDQGYPAVDLEGDRAVPQVSFPGVAPAAAGPAASGPPLATGTEGLPPATGSDGPPPAS